MITRMIKRRAQVQATELLDESPAVGVFGPRQEGKTTSDARKLREPEAYFDLYEDRFEFIARVDLGDLDLLYSALLPFCIMLRHEKGYC